jgi:hypothetical protein
MRFRGSLVVVSLLMSPLSAQAQPPVAATDAPRLVISDDAIRDGLVASQSDPRDDHDSIWNGTVIGAVVGGAVMGGFVTFLCNALREPSDPSCLKSSLLATGIGAGAGAAAGAGVDAMLDQGRRAFVVQIPLGK